MQKTKIFVFGSNLRGVHGAGSAKHARFHYGAELGVGVGRTGDAYAIPTKDYELKVLPLEKIKPHVEDFLQYAKLRQELIFEVVKVGCGLAGYPETSIAPFFKGAPDNIILPLGWRTINGELERPWS